MVINYRAMTLKLYYHISNHKRLANIKVIERYVKDWMFGEYWKGMGIYESFMGEGAKIASQVIDSWSLAKL